jgi:hypothetical protein
MKARLGLILALTFAAMFAVLPGGASARSSPATTAPGKYTDWGGEIDELEILAPFKLADYDRVIVEPFDTSAAKLPDPDDNTYVPVQRVLSRARDPFASGLAELPQPVLAGEMKKPEGGALVVRGKILKMDPGSQAARYWAGFGAGAAKTEVTAEVIDARTGDVLLRFHQERRSGVGSLGGGYDQLLDRNLWTIGKDLGDVLLHF